MLDPKSLRPLKSGEDEFRFVLDNFAINSAELTPSHKARLDRLATLIKHTPLAPLSTRLIIALVGSASQSGNDDYNMGLSKRRAQSAKEFLNRAIGLAPVTYKTFGLGETDPYDEGIIENSRDRSVAVLVRFSTIPRKPDVLDPDDFLKPSRPPPCRRPSGRFREFSFQVVNYSRETTTYGWKGLSGGHDKLKMNFVVTDIVAGGGKVHRVYNFVGNGAIAGVSGINPIPFSSLQEWSTKAGALHKFSADADLDGSKFSGRGVMKSGEFSFGGSKVPSCGWHFPYAKIRSLKLTSDDYIRLPPDIGTPSTPIMVFGRVKEGYKKLLGPNGEILVPSEFWWVTGHPD